MLYNSRIYLYRKNVLLSSMTQELYCRNWFHKIEQLNKVSDSPALCCVFKQHHLYRLK